jgi:glycosyltransferase involved in cell wall biosynthesis
VLHGAGVPGVSDNRNSARGYVEDLSPLIASCHFILWPSEGSHYKFQTSGNTFQAIANGTPIIVPAGCLPARLLDEYGLDYPRFDEQSAESVMKAARALMSHYPEYKAKALLAAERWRLTNGTKKFVDHLITLC